jgi:hypothetical protein
MIAPHTGRAAGRGGFERFRHVLAPGSGDQGVASALAVLTWWPARQRVAAAAVLLALLTAAAAVGLGDPTLIGGVPLRGLPTFGAVTYVATVVLALFVPGAMIAQVAIGMALAGSMLLSQSLSPLGLLPLVAGVVATAELLGVAARLDTPGERNPRGELRRAAGATGIAAAVYAVVLLVGGVPGPAGLLAIVVASGTCAGIAFLLLRHAR